MTLQQVETTKGELQQSNCCTEAVNQCEHECTLCLCPSAACQAQNVCDAGRRASCRRCRRRSAPMLSAWRMSTAQQMWQRTMLAARWDMRHCGAHMCKRRCPGVGPASHQNDLVCQIRCLPALLPRTHNSSAQSPWAVCHMITILLLIQQWRAQSCSVDSWHWAAGPGLSPQ